MSNIGTTTFGTQISVAPNGAILASSPTPLFDGKSLVTDNTTELFENVGTGTFLFADNKINMSVTEGQYCIRQSRRYIPYFSGFPLLIELTSDGFNIQSGKIKRQGYFSGSATAPYDSNLDGFFLEMDGSTHRIKSMRNGVETANVPFHAWDGHGILSEYDFNNFSAIYFDFLWLGGAALRLWVCTAEQGWVLAHSVKYIGNNVDTICLSPNQPIRYEIRSTTGAGSFRPICSQVSVVGQDIESLGYARISINTTGISCNNIGTVYALQGIKKNSTYRNIVTKFENIQCTNGATSDTGILLLLRNPTLSAPLTYSTYGKIDRAIATNQTVSNVGEIISAVPANEVGIGVPIKNYRNWLTQTIGNTFDEYVLAYIPQSTNQIINGIVTYKEFT